MNDIKLFEILSNTFKEVKHLKIISKTDVPQRRVIIKIVMTNDRKYLLDYLISSDGKPIYNCYQYIGKLPM